MNTVAKNSMLDTLADRIKDDIGRRENSREEWVSATLDLCQHLAEAREQFPDNREFSPWLKAKGLGEDVLSHQERAAAIAMGGDLKTAEKILTTTERRSLRVIHAKEFTVTNAGKNKKAKKPPRIPPEVEKIVVKAVFEEGKTGAEAGAAAGVSSTVVRRVVAAEEGRREVADVDLTDLKKYLSLSAQEKFDALERRLRKNMDAQIREAARQMSIKNMDEIFLPAHKEKLAIADKVIKARKGLMSKADFNLIRSCLHPDNSAGPDRRARAFDLFNSLEVVVLDEVQKPVGGAPPLPATMAEWQALRDKVTADRRAKKAQRTQP